MAHKVNITTDATENYRSLWLSANEAHRKMFAWFVFAWVQAIAWMVVAIWVLTR